MLRPLRLLAIAGLLGVAACRPVPGEVAYRLADYASTASFLALPGRLIPGDAQTFENLGQGWSPALDWTDAWIVATKATVGFTAPGGYDVAMSMETRAFSRAATHGQRMTVYLNGQRVSEIEIPDQWTVHDITLPGDLVAMGYNHVELRFAYTAGPAETAGKPGGRELAMRVRGLTIGSESERWPTMAVMDTEDTGSPVLDLTLSTNSLYEVLIDVPAGARLRGSLTGTPTADTYATIELITAPRDADAETIIEIWRESPRDQPSLDIDLSDWGGQVVGLRVRTNGSAGGMVTWRDLQVVAPPAAIPASARPLAGLQAPPLSKRLERPDIYLIILDAARADAFSPYGATRPTPAAAALADEGTVYTNAYSAAPWTGQGMTSLLTGRDPEAHGVDRWGRRLPEGIPLLQEVVGTLGYHTVLWTQHTMYEGNSTLRRGFDRYVKIPIDEPLLPDPKELFLDGYPTFALIHYLPPHGPYAPPAPYLGTYSSWTDEKYPANGQFLARFPRLLDPSEMTPDHLRYVRDRYDDNVLWADSIVGGVVDLLKQHGRYDDALIILASDHGEGFMEHGFFLHTRFLYDEVLRVPLIMKWPTALGGYTARVDTVVSTTQLPATIADLLGIDAPIARFQGRTLSPATFGGDTDYPPLLYSSRGRASRDALPAWMAAMRFDDMKVHHYSLSDTTELYDLASDPSEQHDLSDEMPSLTAYLLQQMRLRQSLSRKLRSIDGTAEGMMELSEEARRELRALGYIQ